MNREKLHNLIVNSGHTQLDIANKMGVSPQLLNYMMRKPKRMRCDQIVLLALALNKSPRTLFTLITTN